MAKPTKEVLEEALALLRRDGWVQWTLHDDEGRRCARGAVLDAVGGVEAYGDDWLDPDYLLGVVAKEKFPARSEWPDVVNFNNHHVTTFPDVEAVFEEAIRRS